jgi:hypothetical protein
MTYRNLSDLNKNGQTRNIKVKVMRLWEYVKNKTEQLVSFDTILMNENVIFYQFIYVWNYNCMINIILYVCIFREILFTLLSEKILLILSSHRSKRIAYIQLRLSKFSNHLYIVLLTINLKLFSSTIQR